MRGPHCGYTLTELLVVMIILTILVAATLPVARRVMDDSRTREASRQLNSMLTLARTRAAQTGRPFGVYFELNPPIGSTGAAVSAGPPPIYVRQATKFYLAEVPPLYGGGTLGARATVTTSAGQYVFLPITSDGMGGYVTDSSEVGLLRSLIPDGEAFLVRFDYKGEWFKFIRSGNDFITLLAPSASNGSDWPRTATGTSVRPPTGNPAGYPFQVLRMPRRVGNPLELAGGTAVDLSYSGFGTTGIHGCLANLALAVMFMPSGGIDGIVADGTVTQPLGTLHFLVGKVEKVGNALGSGTSNLDDPNALWVSIGRQNGTVTTSENMPDVTHATHHSDPWGTGRGEYLEECRSAATGREQMGGQ